MKYDVFGRLIGIAAAVIIAVPVSLFATYGTSGSGPDDLYGGPGLNKNYCTPYHLLQPGDVEDKVYEFLRPDDIRTIDKEHYQYWTKGNNISRSTTIDGLHVQGTDWQQRAIGAEYPRGSSFGIFRSFAPESYSFGEFTGRAPKDTSRTHFISGAQFGGKIPEDQSYRQDLDYVGKMGNTWGVHVSTRPDDVADWPAEFSDENGVPIIKSDEDVVIVYTNIAYAIWPINGSTWRDGYKGGYSPYNLTNNNPFIEYRERIMSFGGSTTQDILFHEFEIENKSNYHTLPGIGPYDVEGLLMGPHLFDTTLGDDDSSQRWAWVDALRFFFTYEEDFTDPAMPDQPTPLMGVTILKSFPIQDPATGDSVQVPITSVSHAAGFSDQGTWGRWVGDWAPTPTKAYNVALGSPEWAFVQDPQRDPALEGTMVTQISSGFNAQGAVVFGDEDFTLCPGETTEFAWALVCAFPVGGDPSSLATTPDGLSVVAQQLIANAGIANTLYPDFKMAKAPDPPNVKLIPGDHQVMISWDNVSMYSRDDFYDVLEEQNNVVDYREYDFEGYRLYRSTSGQVGDAVLLAQFDLNNGIVLDTGIRGKMTKVVIDGEEVEVPSATFLDTIGISANDYDNGKNYGLGKDTGLRFSYVDRYEERGEYGQEPARAHRLTNGFRYFYAVTAYDYNGNSPEDMSSLESPLIFGEHNMVIPRSNSSSYKAGGIDQQLFDIELVGGSGNLLDTSPKNILVAGGIPLDEAEPSNAMQSPYNTIVDADLLDEYIGDSPSAYYYVKIDSIVGEPDNVINPTTDSEYKQDFWNKIFVSLRDESGNTLWNTHSMLRTEGDDITGTTADFVLHPAPDSVGNGVPFNIEFSIPPYDARDILYAPVEVETGGTLAEQISVATGYNTSGGSVPVGMRAADIEITWQSTSSADSLTLSVYDRTHEVTIPYRPLYGAGWTFYSSQGRFGRLSLENRAEIDPDDVDRAGVTDKISIVPNRRNKVAATMQISGFQVKFDVDVSEDGGEARVPKAGDVWVLRTNCGGLPADSLGYLDAKTRPPVEGVSYRVEVKNDSNDPQDANLNEIKVVPNPYIASDAFDRSSTQKLIYFTNLPNRAVIRIYTISGNLIQVLRHEGMNNSYDHFWKGGQEPWNLRNRFNMLVASGWYIWHVTDLQTGDEQRGKFAIIQ